MSSGERSEGAYDAVATEHCDDKRACCGSAGRTASGGSARVPALERYRHHLKGHCDYMRSPDNFFIVRLHSRWECVDSLGTIDVHNAGACFIESVTPIR